MTRALSPRLRTVLERLSKGEPLYFDGRRWKIGGDAVNGNVIGPALPSDRGLVREKFAVAGGRAWYELTDAGTRALERAP